MRVISGKARRTNLQTLQGLDIRPTTDRIKETLFNILTPYIYGCNFMDLFSGSGAIGIEALSRGARNCIFIDNNKNSIECINKNLVITKLNKGNDNNEGIEDIEVLQTEVINGLNLLENKGRIYDIIFIDPPYDLLHERKVLEYLSKSKLINEDTIIIIEASLGTKFDYVESLSFNINKMKKYKNNQHIFLNYIK